MDILSNSFLNWLVGGNADENRVPQLQWLNAPESWGVFVLIGLVIALMFFVFWLYTREIDTCPRRVKLLLAGLRFCVLILLIIIFLRPSISFVETRIRKPNVVLLRDSSQSMQRTDEYRDPDLLDQIAAATGLTPAEISSDNITRADVMNRLFSRDNQQLLSLIRQQAHVRVVDFADSTSKVTTFPAISAEPSNTAESDSGQSSQVTPVANRQLGADGVAAISFPELNANGRSTDIWQALKEALGVSQLAGIILCSDGQHTAADDPIEIAQSARDSGIPIYVIGIGDPNRPRNIAISEVFVLAKARPDEPFEIDALITGQDVAGETVSVELIEQLLSPEDGKPGPERTVQTQSITFAEESAVVRHRFTRRVSKPGKYVYTVKADSLVGEDQDEDNARVSSVVEVTNEKVKVLLIAGSPSWEYQMVHRLLQRDQGIVLSCWLQTLDTERTQEGNDPISALPRTYEQLAKYNVIMMFDPNPDEFDEEWMKALQKFVDQNAGGLFYKAGPKYTSLFLSLRRTELIKRLLPIEFGDTEDNQVSQLLASTTTRAAPLQLVIPNLDHQVMSFYPDRRDNLNQWENLPGIYWSYPAREGKPTTRVLIEHSDITLAADGNNPRPLLVAGRYGAGNTLYMGFNGSWRWRRSGRQAEFFDKFWIQVTRYLVNTRSVQGLRRGTVDTDKPSYELGDRIQLSARLLDPRYEPLTLEEVSGTLQRGESGTPIPVKFKKLPGQDGDYELTQTASQIGRYELTVQLPGTNEENGVEPVRFRVNPPSVETKAFWLNEKLLRDIALTSGGEYFEYDQLEDLPDSLVATPEAIEWRSRPEPIWDLNSFLRMFCFILPVALLTIEWAIRKGYKLL